jgi:putative hemolysin
MVIAQAENFLSGVVNPEFAVCFDQGCTAQIERTEAIVEDVCLEDSATLAEESLSKAFAVGEVRGRESL